MMRIHKKVQQGQMPIADVVKTVCHDKYANLCRAKGQISFAPDIFLFYPSTKHRRAEYLFGKTFSILETENPDKAWDSVCHIYYTAKRRLCTFVNSRQIFGTLWPSANTVASHIYDTFTTFPRKTKLNVSTSQDLTLATIDTKHHHIYKLSTYYESNQIKIAILRSQLFILMDLLLWY